MSWRTTRPAPSAFTRPRFPSRYTRLAGNPPRTATEFDLPRLYTLNAGQASTCDSLIRQFRNGPETADPDRVGTFVRQLRRKLGDDPAKPSDILTGRGVGCRVPKPDAERGSRDAGTAPEVFPWTSRARGRQPPDSVRGARPGGKTGDGLTARTRR